MVEIGHIPSRVRTELTGFVGTNDTDFPVASTARFVVPCAVLVGHADAWHDPTVTYTPELVWITQVLDGQTLRCALSDRGISGTSPREHDGVANPLTVTAVLDERNWERLRDELYPLPRGTLGYAQVTANQTGIGGVETDLTGLSVTVDVPAGRRLRVTGRGSMQIVDSARIVGEIYQGGARVGRWADNTIPGGVASQFFSDAGQTVLTPAAGSYTYKLTMQRVSGVGTADLIVSSSQPAFVLVEDIGAA